MDYFKREIRTMAEFKMNMLTFYTEHVFKLQKHPDIAPPDGITTEQVKELSEYAKQYHVELVGNFQSPTTVGVSYRFIDQNVNRDLGPGSDAFALQQTGGVNEVDGSVYLRLGKFIEVELAEGASPDEARRRLDEMCRKLLANTVIEDYRIEL